MMKTRSTYPSEADFLAMERRLIDAHQTGGVDPQLAEDFLQLRNAVDERFAFQARFFPLTHGIMRAASASLRALAWLSDGFGLRKMAEYLSDRSDAILEDVLRDRELYRQSLSRPPLVQ